MSRPYVVLPLTLVFGLACGGESRPEDKAGPPELTASLVQQRVDEGTRTIDVQMTNAGQSSIHVGSVQLAWSGTTPVPATPKDTDFAPGQIIDLKTAYGEAVCPPTSSDPPSAVLTVDGERVEVIVDAGGRALLDRLHGKECGLRRVAEAASIAFGPESVPTTVRGQEYLRATLELVRPERGSGEPVTVEALLGSVMLVFAPADGPRSLPVTLARYRESLTLPVWIGPTNLCTAHAFAESKQTFILSVFVRVGTEPTQRLILSPDKATQLRLLAMKKRHCLSG
jgi:hypothetical protein